MGKAYDPALSRENTEYLTDPSIYSTLKGSFQVPKSGSKHHLWRPFCDFLNHFNRVALVRPRIAARRHGTGADRPQALRPDRAAPATLDLCHRGCRG